MEKPPWDVIKVLCSEYDYTTFQDEEFCCMRVTHTAPDRRCLLCSMHHALTGSGSHVGECDSGGRAWHGDHAMTERRLLCTSPSCTNKAKCEYKWKVWSCPASSTWAVWYNGAPHSRGVLASCEKEHPPVLTEAIKKYILQQDEFMVPPLLILSNMKADPEIKRPRRGYPDLQLVQNCVKYLRRRDGTKNALFAVRGIAEKRHFNVDLDDDTAFIFGATEDEGGFAYVGEGVDDDPFILGVTSRRLLQACVRFGSADRTTVFHADATFKLSDIGYPSITCRFTDASRGYQLAAIFVVSRRTSKEYSMCLDALVRVLHRVIPGAELHIDFLMGDAEDAQLNAFHAVTEFSSATFLMCFFHVVYNVRKRTRHLSAELRRIVM